MCVKIIHSNETLEFNPSEPLEQQVDGATQVVVSYDPMDPTIKNVEIFVEQMEKFCKTGTSCNAEIRVNTNNHLTGLRLKRKLEKIKKALATNELIKKITIFHAEADRKLSEISQMCLGENE